MGNRKERRAMHLHSNIIIENYDVAVTKAVIFDTLFTGFVIDC